MPVSATRVFPVKIQGENPREKERANFRRVRRLLVRLAEEKIEKKLKIHHTGTPAKRKFATRNLKVDS